MKFGVLFLLFLSVTVNIFSATCPTTINVSSITTISATCPANGSATINSNAGALATYKLISGPQTGYPTNQQTSNVFSTLSPGDYQVLITCGSATQTASFKITSNYTAPTITAELSEVCGNYQKGGKITVMAAGSSTPLVYGYLKSTNPNAPDADFTYGNLNYYNAQDFGTYQVRVKDACNNFVTQTVEIQPTFPQAKIQVWGTQYPDCNNIKIQYDVINPNTSAGFDPAGLGYKISAWASTTADCANLSSTPFINNQTFGDNISNIPSNALSIKYSITSPCGEVYTECLPIKKYNPKPIASILTGCGSGNNNAISFNFEGIPNFSLKITGYNQDNSVAFSQITYPSQSTTLFKNLPSAHHYNYTLYDGCGNSFTGTVNKPLAGTGAVTDYWSGSWCTTQIGTSVFQIFLGGSIPGLADMSLNDIKLINTITNQTFTSVYIDIATNEVRFYNVPNGTYKLQLNAPSGGCVTEINVTLTNSDPFRLALTNNVTQQCGTGSINAVAAYNGGGAVTYKLKSASGSIIATNGSGYFTNIAPGDYTVVVEVNADCMNSTNPQIVTASNTFKILAPGAQPQIIRKMGVKCDANSSTGIALFSFVGSGPFLLEMKKATDATWTTINTATPNDYKVENLIADTKYDVRISDQCGITNATQVEIRTLGIINKLSNVNPCVGQPYTMGVEYIPTATYEWRREGSNTIISTSNKIEYQSYSSENDGKYEVTVKVGDCITRVENFQLNSAACGQALFVHFGYIDAKKVGENLVVKWASLKEVDNLLYDVEASLDGINFKSIGTVKTKAPNGNSIEKIDYAFTTPISQASKLFGGILLGLMMLINAKKRNKLLGVMLVGFIFIVSTSTFSCKKTENSFISSGNKGLFIRIATIDKDGVKSYSKIIKVAEE